MLIQYIWDYTTSVSDLQLTVFLALYVAASSSPSTSFFYHCLPWSLYSATSSSLSALRHTHLRPVECFILCSFPSSLIVSFSISIDLCTSIPWTKKPFLTIAYKNSIPESYLLSIYYHLMDFINLFISVFHHENISSMRVSTQILLTIVVQAPKIICLKKKKSKH